MKGKKFSWINETTKSTKINCPRTFLGMGKRLGSYHSNEKSSGQKNHTTPRPAVNRVLCLTIEKLDMKKCAQQQVTLGETTPCIMSDDYLEVKYPDVHLSLDTSQENVNVINDSDSEEVPIKVSSTQEKEARRLARFKQLEKMRAFEAAFSRQNRYQKRINNMKSVKLSIKKVKWKKDDLFVYHFYDSEQSSDTD